jgi:hypothetical protein
LSPQGNGHWIENVLYSFKYLDKRGFAPSAGVIFDSNGNLYGTTTLGGSYTWGTVFTLFLDTKRNWTKRVLYSFGKNGRFDEGGVDPTAALVFRAGSLYSTTYLGGTGWGTVFRLRPNGKGEWDETSVHSFRDHPGASPLGEPIIFDKDGHAYGTTGGDFKTTFGSVFEITP